MRPAKGRQQQHRFTAAAASTVANRVRKLRGQAGVNAFDAAKSGTHAPYQGDLMSLIKETSGLADALRK